MTYPASSSTTRSSLEDAPLRPQPIPSPTHQPRTAHSATSSSYFTAPRSIPSSRPNQGYATYRPRPSSSSLSLRESGRSASRGRWPTSASRSVSRSREPELNNWNILQDLVDDPEQEDDSATAYGTPDAMPTPRVGGGMSARSLRSFFSLPPEEDGRAIAIQQAPPRHRGTEDGDTIVGILSTSPSAMNGLEAPPSTILERTSEEDGRGDKDGAGRGASDSLLNDHPAHSIPRPSPSLANPTVSPKLGMHRPRSLITSRAHHSSRTSSILATFARRCRDLQVRPVVLYRIAFHLRPVPRQAPFHLIGDRRPRASDSEACILGSYGSHHRGLCELVGWLITPADLSSTQRRRLDTCSWPTDSASSLRSSLQRSPSAPCSPCTCSTTSAHLKGARGTGSARSATG